MKITARIITFFILLTGCSTQMQPATEKVATPHVETPDTPELYRLRFAVEQENGRTNRINEYIAAHPDAPKSLLNFFAKPAVAVGMTPEQVRVVMGRPWTVNTSGGVGGTFDQWVYLDVLAEPTIYLYLLDGKLVRWQGLK